MTGEDSENLMDLVRRYLRSESLPDAVLLIVQHDNLRSQAAVDVIDGIIPVARRHDDAMADHIEMLRDLLVQCVNDGPDAALAALASSSGGDPLAVLTMRFVQAEDWLECRRILEEDPRLLDYMLEALEARLVHIVGSGLVGVAQTYSVTLRLLRRCHEIGIARAVAELVDAQGTAERIVTPASDFADEVFTRLVKQETVTLESVEEAVRLAHLVAAFVESDSWPAAGRIVEANPELRESRVIALFAQLAAEEDDPTVLDNHRRFLERFADVGMRAAGEMAGEGTDPLEVGMTPPRVPEEFARDVAEAWRLDESAREPEDSWKVVDEAMAAWQAIIDRPGFAVADLQFRCDILNSAAIAYARKDHLGKDRAALDGLIRCWTELIDLGHGVLPWVTDGYIANLAVALRKRYDRYDADLTDLETAIAYYERLNADGTSENHDRIANHASALIGRFDRLGRPAMEDLIRSVDLITRAIEIAKAEGPVESWYHGTLSTGRWQLFEIAGRSEDLDAAIDAGRTAVAAAKPRGRNLTRHEAALANCLATRFEAYGQLGDLDEAIETGRAALESLEVTDQDMADRMAATAAAHPEWFRDRGLATDFTAVISRDDGPNPLLPGLLSNLAMDLRTRFRETGNTADIEEAITRLRAAVEATPAGHPDLVKCTLALSGAYLDRFRHSMTTDLDLAIGLGEAALDLTPEGHPGRGAVLSNLKHALVERFERTDDPGDRQRAIQVSQWAVDETPDGPDRAFYLMHLGDAIDRRARPSLPKSWQSPPEARKCWEEVLTMESAAPKARAMAARVLGHQHLTAGKGEEALRYLTQGVAQLPLLAWKGLDRATRAEQLGHWGGLAREAAAAAIAAGKPDQAIELLEHGRSMLWAQALETRTDFTDLRDSPEGRKIAQRIEELRADLAQGDDPVARRETTAADRRIGWARDWDRALDEARSMNKDIFRPRTAGELAAAAEGGTVIVLNFSGPRNDALLIRPEGVERLHLAVTADEILQRVRAHLDAVQDHERRRIHPDSFEEALADVLDWLWRTIAGPCLSAAGITGPGRSRVWWCPTGPLVNLPLHAAGYHDGSKRSVLDRTISSYTSTVSALLRARSRPAAGGSRLLTVGVPHSPGASPLPLTWREVITVARGVGEDRVDLLYDTDATVAKVRAELPGHPWAHFSCHGSQDPRQPDRGALHLADGPLPLLDIAALRLDDAEFAYLSACQSAVGGLAVPDEAIHLAGALQLAGFRHVVATLWAIYEEPAVEMAGHVYRHLAAGAAGLDGSRAAAAVHDAAVLMRADHGPGSLWRWLPFVHFGP